MGALANQSKSYHARTALIVGAGGGIGSAFIKTLDDSASADMIIASARQPISAATDRIRSATVDLTDEQSIARLATSLGDYSNLDLVLIATGMLHADDELMPEKRLADIEAQNLARAFAINTTGPALVAKHLLPRLARDRKTVFAVLTARVGSIGDNRKGGWYAYRASKAALNMVIRTAAIELARTNPRAAIVGLHPGTVDTRLSRPFQARVPDHQLFTADEAAKKLLNVIAGVGPEHSGLCLAWDGSVIPP